MPMEHRGILVSNGAGEPCPKGCRREGLWYPSMPDGGDVVPKHAGWKGCSTQGCGMEGMWYPGMQEGVDAVPRDAGGRGCGIHRYHQLPTDVVLQMRMPFVCHHEES